MGKGFVENWRQLGRIGQAFLLATALFLLLYFLQMLGELSGVGDADGGL